MTAPIGHKLLCSNFATAAPFYLKNYKAVNKGDTLSGWEMPGYFRFILSLFAGKHQGTMLQQILVLVDHAATGKELKLKTGRNTVVDKIQSRGAQLLL
ncbi:hypothetical protein ACET3Z_011030 [Daucus carota]